MSNSQQPNYKRETFTDFLTVNGYIGKMSMDSENIVLTKEKSEVIIPYEETLTKSQIIRSLDKSDLSFADFEEYLDHLNAMKNFTHYVDKSKK